ncbi:MAG: ung [Bacillota bacterium]|nr:MAG: ung [Bacillota bacterium]
MINNVWHNLLEEEFQKDYYQSLCEFLKQEYETKTIYPALHFVFEALKLSPYNKVRVVILGQDPYHGEQQAHGLAFSVQQGVDIPPSLLNIYKELHTDLGCYVPNNGHLVPWAEQGVLLLNTSLTVRANSAASHRGKGWEQITDRIIGLLNEKLTPVVFLLWGNHAKAKAKLVTNPQHMILTSVHPSPLSAHRGFFGCKHFSKANDFLHKLGQTEIDWQIPNI